MTTFKQLPKEQQQKIRGYLDELLRIDQQAIDLFERWITRYSWEMEQMRAFLKNQRTTDQLLSILNKHEKTIKELIKE